MARTKNPINQTSKSNVKQKRVNTHLHKQTNAVFQ